MKEGTLFGNRYKIIKEIGKGGMGSIYLAHDQKLSETVALKLLLPDFEKHPEVIKRFIQEIKLSLKITHENVVRIYDIGDAEGVHFISMEYIKGNDLKDIIKTLGAQPMEQGLFIMKQILKGLASAHKKGIIHRDMKPQNVIVTTENIVKILDFGIAKLAEEESKTSAGMTRDGMVIGTPEYMSPEQALAKKVDLRTDIYAVGVIMYELFTGKLPFESSTPMNILVMHIKEIADAPSMINPDIPLALEHIIIKAMEKEPADRYQTVDEMLTEIRRAEDNITSPVELDELEVITEAALEVVEEISDEVDGSTEDLSVDQIFQKGLSAFQDRDYSTALRYFEDVIARDPNHPQAYDYVEITGDQIAKKATVSRLLTQGDNAFEQQDYRTAYKTFQKAMEMSPDNPVAQIGFKKVSAVYDPATDPGHSPEAATTPTTPAAKPEEDADDFERGKKLFEQRKFDEAIDALQAVLGKDANHSGAFELLEMAKASKSTQEQIEHHFLTAKRLFSDGDMAAAAQELEIALDFDPDYSEANELLEEIKNITGNQNIGSSQAQQQGVIAVEMEGAGGKIPLARNPDFQSHLQEVQRLVKERDYEEAVAVLEKTKTLFPHDDAEIDTYIKKVRTEQKKTLIKAHFLKGNELLSENKYRQAISQFKRVLEIDPNNGKAKHQVDQCRAGLVTEQKKQEESQKIKLSEATSRIDSSKIPRSRGKSPILMGIVAIVIVACGVVLVTQLSRIKSWYADYSHNQGMVYFSQKQYDKAAGAIQKAYDMTGNPELLEKLGEAYFHSGSFGQAEYVFKQLIKEKGNKSQYRFFLGKIYEKNGSLEKAITEFKKTVAVNPKHSQAYASLGKLYGEQKNYQAAIKNMRASLRLKKDQPDLQMALAQTYLATSNPGAAAQVLSELISKHSSYREAFTELGKIYIRMGRYNSAVTTFKKHPGFSSGSAEIFFNMGLSYEKLGQRKNAVEYYRKCFIIDSTYNDVVIKLGNMLKAQKDSRGALQIYTQYLEEHGDKCPILLKIGEIYNGMRKYAPAIEYYDRATRADPKSVEAWNKLGDLQRRRGNKREARTAYRKSLELNPNQSKIKWWLNSLK